MKTTQILWWSWRCDMKRETLIGLLMVVGAITLLFSQYCSYKEQGITGNLIECMDVQIKFQDIRAVMNEYLLRYVVSEEVVANHLKNNYTIKVPLFEPFRIYENPVNLTRYFDKETNLQWYFNETGNLNLVRPMWEDCTSKLFLFENQIEKYSFWANLFLLLTLIIYASVIYLYFKNKKLGQGST